MNQGRKQRKNQRNYQNDDVIDVELSEQNYLNNKTVKRKTQNNKNANSRVAIKN